MSENEERMNFRAHEFSTKEEGLEKLKGAVRVRNSMGGALYWNIVNDDCLRMAGLLMSMGVPKADVVDILNG